MSFRYCPVMFGQPKKPGARLWITGPRWPPISDPLIRNFEKPRGPRILARENPECSRHSAPSCRVDLHKSCNRTSQMPAPRSGKWGWCDGGWSEGQFPGRAMLPNGSQSSRRQFRNIRGRPAEPCVPRRVGHNLDFCRFRQTGHSLILWFTCLTILRFNAMLEIPLFKQLY
jgi:hypothetical protein